MIVDASVATKWLVREDGLEAARDLLRSSEPLLAPDLIRLEVGHALWKKVRLEQIASDVAERGYVALPAFFQTLTPTGSLLAAAFDLAERLVHPAYDCVYLALALAEDSLVVTADKGFIEAARVGGYASRVKSYR